MNIISEYELAVRLRQGDIKAFDALYQKLQGALYLNIVKLTHDEEISRDILQEVFVMLWEKRETIDPEKTISGWLFKVSFRMSIAYLKKKLRRPETLMETDDINRPEEFSIDLVEYRSRLLNEAIEKLSPQKRKVFELCKIEGKSYEETAKELNISKHTVNEYLVGAVQMIRKYIHQHPEYQSALFPAFIAAMLL